MLVIQKLNEEKLAAVSGTEKLEAFLPCTLSAALENGLTPLLMLVEGRPVGAILLGAQPEGEKPVFLRVCGMAVLPEVRRHGLGRMLMSIAAGESVQRQVWFLGADAPGGEDASGFAKAMHFKPAENGTWLLDLSDVEGMRHG